jgi:hypothetical protein
LLHFWEELIEEERRREEKSMEESRREVRVRSRAAFWSGIERDLRGNQLLPEVVCRTRLP